MGAWLARERELRGIGLDELVRITRIPRRSLERLESGAFDSRPDGFTRGFVRAVAEAIGLDPEVAVARLLAEPEPGPTLPVARIQTALLLLFGLSVGLVLLFGGVHLARLLATASADPAEAPSVRRDPVRALAEAEGVLRPRVLGGPEGGSAADRAPEGESRVAADGPTQSDGAGEE